MVLENWNEYPEKYEVVKKDVFFDEFRSNLIAVIRDYSELGHNNEPQMIANANTLFSGDIVPSRSDWSIIQETLIELAKNKEFSTLQRNFFGDVHDSLGISDLQRIREFLDAVQTINPQSSSIAIGLPAIIRTRLTTPSLWSPDNYKESIYINWAIDLDSVAPQSATITAARSISEDISYYILRVYSGSASWSKTFNPHEQINYSLPLKWTEWYPHNQLSGPGVAATLEAYDKRGNAQITNGVVHYPGHTVVQTPINFYRIEYQIDGSNWIHLGDTHSPSWVWSNIPKKTGTYQFRVMGIELTGVQTDWVYSERKYFSYLPDPPEKPNPTYTSTSKAITISWQACARAEYYEVYNWSTPEKAIEMSVNGNVYYKKVMANQTRSVTLYNFSSNSSHGISVKAVNAGGEAIGYVSAKTKANPLLKKSYSTQNSRVWRGAYKFLNSWGGVSHHAGKVWRDEKDAIYQGEWKEVKLGGWRQRGGNGSYYMAYDGNTWGNNMSFLFFDYGKMRNELRGKKISKVTISINRSTAGAHGFPQANPIYIYNHNRDNNTSTTTANAFTLFRPDNKTAVSRNNQKATANVRFDRGETERISNDWTKKLITNIIDGSMRGLGIVKYYGDYFNTNATYSDRAYMRLSGKVKIDIEYYNE